MKDLILTILYIGSVILAAILIVVAMIIRSTPNCDNSDGKVVAFKADTASNDYQIGTCQNGIIKYEEVNIFKMIMKIKYEY